MRLLPESGHELASPDSSRSGLRSRVLQRAPEHSSGGGDQEAIPLEVLIAFTRALVANVGGRDIIHLSLLRAQKLTGCSTELLVRFEKAVLQEQDAHSPWPKGFF